MPKSPVSLTIEAGNLLWLRGRAAALGRASLSEAVDRLIAEARAGKLGSPPAPRSVVGTVDIAEDDPGLARADAAIRDLFGRSLSRPVVVKETRASYKSTGRPKRRRG